MAGQRVRLGSGARPIAVGRQVLLRLPRPSDEAELRALLTASARFLAPWEPRHRDRGWRKRFRRYLAARRDPSNRKLLVCRRSDGTILGYFGINNIVRGVQQGANLGTWIGEAFARQGYMTEALGLVLRHAFRDLKLHRVEASFLPSNAASRALATRAGFRREGYSPRYLKIAGRWHDHERWALLAEEWRSGRARRRGRGPVAKGEKRARVR